MDRTDPQFGQVNVTHEGCVLIKLALRLLRCRKPGSEAGGFDFERLLILICRGKGYYGSQCTP